MQLEFNAGVLNDFATGIRLISDPNRTKQALTLAAALMKSQVQKNFRLQRDPETGQAWKPLAFPRILGGNKILYQTGRLRNSLNAALPVVTADSAMISTNVIYARIHNDGGIIRANNARRARPSRNPHLAIPLTRDALRYGSASQWWAANARKPPVIVGKAIGLMVRGQFVPHFALVKQVTIPRRPFMKWGREYAEEQARVVGRYFRDLFSEQTRQSAANPTQGGATP